MRLKLTFGVVWGLGVATGAGITAVHDAKSFEDTDGAPVLLAQLGLGQPKQTDQSVARDAYQAAQLVPYGRIKSSVQEQFQGRVVYQNLSQNVDGGWIYELKVLKDDGHVLMVFVDAVSGEILKQQDK